MDKARSAATTLGVTRTKLFLRLNLAGRKLQSKNTIVKREVVRNVISEV